jgi:hypothetical protein
MGLDVGADQLILVARRREEVRHQNGLIDREVQDVYFRARRVAIQVLRPNSEVMAVAAIPTSALADLATGVLPRVTGIGGTIDERRLIAAEPLDVATVDLVPRVDGYYGRVANFASLLREGDQPPAEPGWW